jgi:accessory gene regulator protein AgrB
LYLLSSYLDQGVQKFELFRPFEFYNSFEWLRIYVRVSVKIFEFLGAFGAKPAIKEDAKKTRAIIINLILLRINQFIKITIKLACRLLIPNTNLT